MNKKTVLIALALAVMCGVFGLFINCKLETNKEAVIKAMVQNHAKAWETGDEELLASLLHKDVVFAYPGRRLNKEQTLEDLRFFRDAYENTKVYIHTIVVDGNEVAVEWQFATTKKETGKREVVRDGQFVIWKEYLDGRVKGLQAEGTLLLEEGEEPFPWPKKIEANR